MKKVILKTFLGFLFAVLGFATAFIYVRGVNEGSSPLLLLLAGVLVIVGIFFLFHAGRQDVHRSSIVKNDIEIEKVGQKSLLEKNEEMVRQYYKTMESRDRLKILKTAAEADNK